MTLLKHPTAGTIIDVTGARAKTLMERGYAKVDGDESDLARQAAMPSGTRAVQPQPPIDTRTNPPELPIETRDQVAEPPIDTRPENPLGPTAGSVEEADGAGLDRGGRERPAKNASRDDWNAYAASIGLDPDEYSSKDDLIAAVDKAEQG